MVPVYVTMAIIATSAHWITESVRGPGVAGFALLFIPGDYREEPCGPLFFIDTLDDIVIF